MKLVAEVSSSIRNREVSDSIPSMILAACDVLPLAFSLLNFLVSLLLGKLFIKSDMSVSFIDLPSSDFIFMAESSVITYSRPSPIMWL